MLASALFGVAFLAVPAFALAATLSVPSGAYPTIQSAITAASPGDTVKVAAGTYTEQLTISKSLTLTGVGAKTTFIKAPATLALDTFSPPNVDIIAIDGPATVTMSGFTVEGPGPSGCDSINYGIFVFGGAVANINNNTISNIADNPFGGCQNGVAIRAGSNYYVTTGTAAINNNLIIGYQKGGIVIDGPGSSATITGNTVTGAGQTTAIAQNGIQISRGATATVSGNTVSGDSYTGLYACPSESYFASVIPVTGGCYQSAGILLYDAGATTVSNNKVTTSDMGIWAGYDNGYGSPTVENITGNTLSKNYGYGVVYDSVNGTSQNNSFLSNPVGLLVTDYSANDTVTSLNDSFLSNPINSEAMDAGAAFKENLIVETTNAFHFPFPIPHLPHFPNL